MWYAPPSPPWTRDLCDLAFGVEGEGRGGKGSMDGWIDKRIGYLFFRGRDGIK